MTKTEKITASILAVAATLTLVFTTNVAKASSEMPVTVAEIAEETRNLQRPEIEYGVEVEEEKKDEEVETEVEKYVPSTGYTYSSSRQSVDEPVMGSIQIESIPEIPEEVGQVVETPQAPQVVEKPQLPWETNLPGPIVEEEVELN